MTCDTVCQTLHFVVNRFETKIREVVEGCAYRFVSWAFFKNMFYSDGVGMADITDRCQVFGNEIRVS